MLDLFPDPAKSPKPKMLRPVRWETVFRRRAYTKAMPRMGTPDVVRPGDTLIYFDDMGRFVSWIVGEVSRTSAKTKPLMSGGFEIRPAVWVKFEDFDEVQRPVYE